MLTVGSSVHFYLLFFFFIRCQGLRVVGGVAANCWSKPGLLVNAKNR